MMRRGFKVPGWHHARGMPDPPNLPPLPLCECGHEVGMHGPSRGTCMELECECKRYAPKERPMTITGNVLTVQGGWKVLAPNGEHATFALEEVEEWGVMRNYGRSQRFSIARLRDGRVVQVNRSQQPKEVARAVDRILGKFDVASPAVVRTVQCVGWMPKAG